MIVIAQIACNLPQCQVCFDAEWWEWILYGCWIIGIDPAAGVAAVSAWLISRAYLWALGQEQA